MKEYLSFGAMILVIGFFLVAANQYLGSQVNTSFQGGNGGLTAAKCSVNTVTSATVGDDISSTVLAANGTRAWAMIEVALGDANNVSLSFDEGAAATLTSGIQLSQSTTSAGVLKQIVFGRNTDFPYIGEVTGITNTSSTTVRVTECSY